MLARGIKQSFVSCYLVFILSDFWKFRIYSKIVKVNWRPQYPNSLMPGTHTNMRYRPAIGFQTTSYCPNFLTFTIHWIDFKCSQMFSHSLSRPADVSFWGLSYFPTDRHRMNYPGQIDAKALFCANILVTSCLQQTRPGTVWSVYRQIARIVDFPSSIYSTKAARLLVKRYR